MDPLTPLDVWVRWRFGRWRCVLRRRRRFDLDGTPMESRFVVFMSCIMKRTKCRKMTTHTFAHTSCLCWRLSKCRQRWKRSLSFLSIFGFLFLSQHLCFIFFHSTVFYIRLCTRFVFYYCYFIIYKLWCSIFSLLPQAIIWATIRNIISVTPSGFFICLFYYFLSSCCYLFMLFIYFCAYGRSYLARKCALIASAACGKPPPPPRSSLKGRLSVLWLRGSMRLALEMRSMAQR